MGSVREDARPSRDCRPQRVKRLGGGGQGGGWRHPCGGDRVEQSDGGWAGMGDKIWSAKKLI